MKPSHPLTDSPLNDCFILFIQVPAFGACLFVARLQVFVMLSALLCLQSGAYKVQFPWAKQTEPLQWIVGEWRLKLSPFDRGIIPRCTCPWRWSLRTASVATRCKIIIAIRPFVSIISFRHFVEPFFCESVAGLE